MKHRWRKKQNGEIDTWAWEIGYCNGPICEDCGRSVCEHCNPDWMDLDDCEGPRIITNADHIRRMSDEELKDFFCTILQCEFCKFEGWGGCECLNWLKQPYKEK